MFRFLSRGISFIGTGSSATFQSTILDLVLAFRFNILLFDNHLHNKNKTKNPQGVLSSSCNSKLFQK